MHTSPLDQPGTGDAGGMNVYVLEVWSATAAGLLDVFADALSGHPLPLGGLAVGR